MAKRILAVDDSKTIRDMVSFTLRKAGFDVDEAEDGKIALSVLDRSRFDLIITDLNMPNMDGISLIKNVRSGASHRGVPILILTTESDSTKKNDGKAAGATGWLVKPFNPEKLVELVQRVCPLTRTPPTRSRNSARPISRNAPNCSTRCSRISIF
jgi:two-component system chemotaxis response regulator CheY